MLSRAVGLTLLILALAAPSAGAAVADPFVPVYDASDGVRAVRSRTGEVLVRFDPKAASIYRTIRARRVNIGCGNVTGRPLDDSGFSTTGYMSGTFDLPRRRGTVRTFTGDTDTEVCAIATRKRKSSRRCLPVDTTDEKWCARVIVAVTDSGAAYLDARARSIELSLTVLAASLPFDTKSPVERARLALGTDDVITLASADDTPPAGQVGYWTDGKTSLAAVALLRDGKRVFVSLRDGVYSTNLESLMGLDNDDAFSVF